MSKELEAFYELKESIEYKAGDSIVTTVLMAIFGQLLGIDYEPIIEKYVDSLVSCNSGCKVQ